MASEKPIWEKIAEARHEGAMAERKAIVDWLVQEARGEYAGQPTGEAFDLAADEIEAGTHLEED